MTHTNDLRALANQLREARDTPLPYDEFVNLMEDIISALERAADSEGQKAELWDKAHANHEWSCPVADGTCVCTNPYRSAR